MAHGEPRGLLAVFGFPRPAGFYCWLLIRRRRTRFISIGTVVRLCVTVGLTLLTIFVLRLPGETAGAASVISAVIAESLLVSYWARRLMSQAARDFTTRLRMS